MDMTEDLAVIDVVLFQLFSIVRFSQFSLECILCIHLVRVNTEESDWSIIVVIKNMNKGIGLQPIAQHLCHLYRMTDHDRSRPDSPACRTGAYWLKQLVHLPQSVNIQGYISLDDNCQTGKGKAFALVPD